MFIFTVHINEASLDFIGVLVIIMKCLFTGSVRANFDLNARD